MVWHPLNLYDSCGLCLRAVSNSCDTTQTTLFSFQPLSVLSFFLCAFTPLRFAFLNIYPAPTDQNCLCRAKRRDLL